MVDSKIISASFKGIRLKDLPPAEEIEIDFQALGNVEGRRSCVFWDFSAAGKKIKLLAGVGVENIVDHGANARRNNLALQKEKSFLFQ